jgi:hypothetical protein
VICQGLACCISWLQKDQRCRLATAQPAQAGPSLSIYTDPSFGRSDSLACTEWLGQSLLQTRQLDNCPHAGRPPIAQRPPNSALLWPRAVFADAKKRKEPPEPGLSHCSTRYEQPFYPLEPEARLACALVELDPRQAPAPKVDSLHGALHRHVRSPAQSGSGATNSLPIPDDV